MSSQTPEQHWQNVYTTKSTSAVSWYQPEPQPSLELIEALGESADAPIIDVGGGASVLVDHLLRRGHTDLTVLDVSAAALAVARERLGSAGEAVDWIAADLLTWTPPRQYRVWHDRAVLHFLTDPADQARYAALLRVGIEPGGYAVIGTFAIGGPEWCSGLPVQQYDSSGIADLAGPDFELTAVRDHDHVTPDRNVQHFSWAVLRRH